MGLLDAQGELAMGNPCCPYPCLAGAECSTPSERPARRAEILRQHDTHPDHLATYKQDFDRDIAMATHMHTSWIAALGR